MNKYQQDMRLYPSPITHKAWVVEWQQRTREFSTLRTAIDYMCFLQVQALKAGSDRPAVWLSSNKRKEAV